MAKEDAFEKVLKQERGEVGHFPLGLCIAGIVSSGAGLAASVVGRGGGGVQWGPGLPGVNGLPLAWTYVQVAAVWTWLLVWPAVALSRVGGGRRQLWWDLGALVVAMAPAVGVAGFLSGFSVRGILPAVGLQVGIGVLALGVMAWRGRIAAGILAGVLAGLGVVAPVAGYVWAEFYPAAVQGWAGCLPVGVVMRGAGWHVAAVYAGIGVAVFLVSFVGMRRGREGGRD